jgi:hypothetical protein
MTIDTAKSPASAKQSSLPAKPRIFSGIQPTGRSGTNPLPAGDDALDGTSASG